MIRQYGSIERPVFVVSTKAERTKLINQGAVVYTDAEFEIVKGIPELKEFAELLRDLKVEFPELTIIGARVRGKDGGH
jgi:ATP-dependent RNA circularization protein (DNA/RNA ligase family)